MKIAKTGVDCILGKVILVKVFPHPLRKNFSLGIIYPFTNPFGQRVWAAVALDSVGHCLRQCESMLTVLRYTVWLLLVTVWATVETVWAAQVFCHLLINAFGQRVWATVGGSASQC